MYQNNKDLKFIVDLSKYDQLIQPSYRPLLFNKNRFLLMCGGAGSGKSYFAAQKLIYRCLSEPNSFHVVVQKTFNSIRNTAFPLLIKIINDLGLKHMVHINNSLLTITFLPPFNSKILSLGIDDPEKLKSLVDPSSIFVEEASQINRKDFDQLNLRLRGTKAPYLQMILSTNPTGGTGHWLYKHFFKKKQENTSIVCPTVFNNAYIDQSYIDALKILDGQNPEMGDIYLRGKWSNAQGLIFKNWNEIRDDQFPKRYSWRCFGIDWGYNDPTTIIECRYFNECLYIKEHLCRTHLTTNEIIEIMKNIKEITSKVEIYCDSAEPDRISSLKLAGYNAFACKKGPNSIVSGINVLKNQKIYITSSSTETIKEFENYCYKISSTGEISDVPIDSFNHSIDAIRYAISEKFAFDNFNPKKPMVFTNLDVKPR